MNGRTRNTHKEFQGTIVFPFLRSFGSSWYEGIARSGLLHEFETFRDVLPLLQFSLTWEARPLLVLSI